MLAWNNKRFAIALMIVATIGASFARAVSAGDKPNILVIMADDIGYWNISAYNRGLMGYRTPNIDRIANEGEPQGERGL